MLPRTLETEVMDTVAEAVDYDAMDHSTVNRVFVDDFLAAAGLDGFGPTVEPRRRATDTAGFRTVFDAGTGTALIPIELVRRGVAVVVTAADAAEEMLKLARRNVQQAGFTTQIDCVARDCKALPEASAAFDAVISNSIIHHIPEPGRVLAELWRITKPGGWLFLRDLLRPRDEATLRQLVQQYAGNESAHQRQMFEDSLHAALTLTEMRALAVELSIPADAVQQTSDRHWTLAVRKSAA